MCKQCSHDNGVKNLYDLNFDYYNGYYWVQDNVTGRTFWQNDYEDEYGCDYKVWRRFLYFSRRIFYCPDCMLVGEKERFDNERNN